MLYVKRFAEPQTHQPPHPRKIPIPSATRAQSGRLVPMGARGVPKSSPRVEGCISLHRLFVALRGYE